jgi:hypothetical protein
MAYQKVGTPRFYIDHIQYLKSINFNFQKWYDDYGFDDTNKSKKSVFNDPDIFTFSPETQKQVFSKHTLIDGSTNVNYLYWDMPTASPNGTNFTSDNVGFFVAMLNHNLNTKGLSPYFERAYDTAVAGVTENSIINYNRGGIPNEDGFSIYETSNINADIADNEPFFRLVFSDPDENGNATDFNIGALSCGFYYDMPVNPDLDLSMSIEYDGFTNIKTLSGHTITQANYQGSPWWYDKDGNKVEPWSVGQSTGTSKRNGRRVWKLKFSYMSDKDLFASNYGSSTYAEDVLPYELGDQDIPNLGVNIVQDSDFDTDVSANTTGTYYTTLNDSVISSGEALVKPTPKSSALNNNTSIGNSYENWSVNQANVFSIEDGDREVRYTIRFRAKKVNSDANRFQMGFGYWSFFDMELTSDYVVYEVPNVRIGERFAEFIHWTENDNYSENAFDNAHSHRLTMGGYPNDGDSDSFKVDWVTVQKHNPSDFTYNIDNDDSFSAQVLNKISHGEKFIFQPDNTSNNPSDFAICVLDGDSFEMKRTAPNVYDIEMTIREVW